MSAVSSILDAAAAGDPQAASQLLPLVYDELRKLAAAKLAHEQSGQTLDATALVHEAYMRLVGSSHEQQFDNRRHFFAAAAEAMRRILIERARLKRSVKHGGEHVRADFDPDVLPAHHEEDLLALDEVLTKLAAVDSQAAELVKLRHFAGLTIAQSAQVLNVSPRTADRVWAFARAWLLRELRGA